MTNGEFKVELEKRTVDFSIAVLRLLRKIPVGMGNSFESSIKFG